MVNRVILIGNLGKDPEVRRLESGAVVAKFSLATSESYKDKTGNWQEQTEWHDIVVWRALAERAEQSLKKGMTIYVEGRLTHRTWQDQDGNNRRTTEVQSNYFRILDRKQSGTPANAPSAATGGGGDQEPPMPNEMDEDLPF
ncbi:MAG: single-stranded DNA-binding protein [Haliscomenobacter sp.]|nr:single-stranded DNA-binding protein [Haliscomenobacter sp.]